MSSSAPVMDVDGLLAPLPGNNPAGENLQYSGLHDQIREARRAEEDLAQGDWQRELKAADWDEVVALSTEALSSRTKDLQVGAWLAEARVKLQGFAGLRDSLRVMRGLHEQFWDSVYPEVEEEDLEARANALAWMNRQLAIAVQEIPITKGGGGGFSFLQWEEAKKLDLPPNAASMDSEALSRLNQERARAVEAGKITTEEFNKSKNATRRAFYEETVRLVSECWGEFEALDRAMDERFGRQTPGLGELKKALDAVRTFLEKTVKEKRVSEPDAVAGGEGAEAGGEAGEEAGPARAGGPVRTRQEALRRLAEVADYFRRTEPHSPVSYLVQRAITWGQMPLDAWLKDVIKDSSQLESLRETLGLHTSVQTGSE